MNLTLKKSVGRSAINRTVDLRIIQVLLLETGFLLPSAFTQECLKNTITNPIDQINSRLSNGNTTVIDLFDQLFDSKAKVDEKDLTQTIMAIETFQREQMKLSNPDGRVDPGGKTFRILTQFHQSGKKRKSENPASNNTLENIARPIVTIPTDHGDAPFQLDLQASQLRVTLRATDGKTRQKMIDLNAARQFIVSRYNWNGIVKLLTKVYQKAGDTYLVSTNLTGTTHDDAIIIPQEAIAHIVRLQLTALTKNKKVKSNQLDRILADNKIGVDGKPGRNFLKLVLKVNQLEKFLDESLNKRMKRIDDESIINIPKSIDQPESIYKFCRDIVLVKNGLWSDQVGVNNIVGFRRIMDQKSRTGFNDTIAVCWLDQDGLPQVELHIATTEPGNRLTKNQLAPQTITVYPGNHRDRQPAGRTHNGLKRMKNGTLKWSGGDTTMNFHQGKNNFKYPSKKWLLRHGFNGELKLGIPNSKYDAMALIRLNAVLSELFLILSHYGCDCTQSAYKNLEEITDFKPIKVKGEKDGHLILLQQQPRLELEKRVNLEAAKKWMLDFWFRKKEKSRSKIFEVLKAITDLSDEEINSWKTKSKEEITKLVKTKYLINVVKKQIEYVWDINDRRLDGKGGEGFVEMLRGIYQPVAKARNDKKRVDELLNQLNEFPLKDIAGLQRKIKGLSIHTENNRRSVFMNTAYDPESDVAFIRNTTVGPSSEGCQVIYDTELFYRFWSGLLERAKKVGQERWYYTLVEAKW